MKIQKELAHCLPGSHQPASGRVRPDRLLKLPEVAELVGMSEPTVRRWTDNGEHGFPAKVKVGNYAVRWRESEILQWIADREAAA
jgi:excisionase family DNA binding protein